MSDDIFDLDLATFRTPSSNRKKDTLPLVTVSGGSDESLSLRFNSLASEASGGMGHYLIQVFDKEEQRLIILKKANY